MSLLPFAECRKVAASRLNQVPARFFERNADGVPAASVHAGRPVSEQIACSQLVQRTTRGVNHRAIPRRIAVHLATAVFNSRLQGGEIDAFKGHPDVLSFRSWLPAASEKGGSQLPTVW